MNVNLPIVIQANCVDQDQIACIGAQSDLGHCLLFCLHLLVVLFYSKNIVFEF